jgi:hypothetical protein
VRQELDDDGGRMGAHMHACSLSDACVQRSAAVVVYAWSYTRQRI